jgi:microcystin-dependent protein
MAGTDAATSTQPVGLAYAKGNFDDGRGNTGGVHLYSANNPDTLLNAAALGPSGASAPHNNMMPYLPLNFCIAIEGIFPSRS